MVYTLDREFRCDTSSHRLRQLHRRAALWLQPRHPLPTAVMTIDDRAMRAHSALAFGMEY
jgi:hypothetical protein